MKNFTEGAGGNKHNVLQKKSSYSTQWSSALSTTEEKIKKRKQISYDQPKIYFVKFLQYVHSWSHNYLVIVPQTHGHDQRIAGRPTWWGTLIFLSFSAVGDGFDYCSWTPQMTSIVG